MRRARQLELELATGALRLGAAVTTGAGAAVGAGAGEAVGAGAGEAVGAGAGEAVGAGATASDEPEDAGGDGATW